MSSEEVERQLGAKAKTVGAARLTAAAQASGITRARFI
jgi:hypothetical protein